MFARSFAHDAPGQRQLRGALDEGATTKLQQHDDDDDDDGVKLKAVMMLHVQYYEYVSVECHTHTHTASMPASEHHGNTFTHWF